MAVAIDTSVDLEIWKLIILSPTFSSLWHGLLNSWTALSLTHSHCISHRHYHYQCCHSLLSRIYLEKKTENNKKTVAIEPPADL